MNILAKKIFHAENIMAIFSQTFDFALCFWIKQDANSTLAKVRQTFRFVNFDVGELVFFLSVSVATQHPLKLKSASNEIAEHCWTESRLVQRGGIFLENKLLRLF